MRLHHEYDVRCRKVQTVLGYIIRHVDRSDPLTMSAPAARVAYRGYSAYKGGT